MADLPNAMNSPPEIDFRKAEIWKPGKDPAKRISYSQHRHALPKITAGGKTFVFPVGVEGFKRSGLATLGIHKYLGRHYVDVHVIHRDEAHIEMTGIFPGLTATKNMQDLTNILTAVATKYLYLPGVFPHIQTVYPENYNFDHDKEDRTHSIEYSIMFVRTTTGKKVNDNQIVLHDLAPGGPSNDKGSPVKGKSDRVVVITDSMKTLRSVADRVYGDADRWRTLVDLNSEVLPDYNKRLVGPTVILTPDYQLAVMRLEVGTRLRY
jgi:hypothetical protein